MSLFFRVFFAVIKACFPATTSRFGTFLYFSFGFSSGVASTRTFTKLLTTVHSTSLYVESREPVPDLRPMSDRAERLEEGRGEVQEAAACTDEPPVLCKKGLEGLDTCRAIVEEVSRRKAEAEVPGEAVQEREPGWSSQDKGPQRQDPPVPGIPEVAEVTASLPVPSAACQVNQCTAKAGSQRGDAEEKRRFQKNFSMPTSPYLSRNRARRSSYLVDNLFPVEPPKQVVGKEENSSSDSSTDSSHTARNEPPPAFEEELAENKDEEPEVTGLTPTDVTEQCVKAAEGKDINASLDGLSELCDEGDKPGLLGLVRRRRGQSSTAGCDDDLSSVSTTSTLEERLAMTKEKARQRKLENQQKIKEWLQNIKKEQGRAEVRTD